MLDKKDVEKRVDMFADVAEMFLTLLDPDRYTLKEKEYKTEDEIKLLNLVKREGDRQEWYSKTRDTNNYHCILKRNMHSGFWFGYVGIPPDHPYFKMDYNDLLHLNVHGGLTYSGWHPDDNTWNEPPPYLSRDEKYWYLGFDCAHAWDKSPFDHYGHIRIDKERYRTKGYAKREVNRLAKQLKLIKF